MNVEKDDAPLREQRGSEGAGMDKPRGDHSSGGRPFVHRFRSGVLRSAQPSSMKLLLLVLAEFADVEGRNCFPSLARIAQLAGLNERTARRLLSRANDWFSRHERAGDGRGWRRLGYTLRIPEGADTAPARHGEGNGDGADKAPSPLAEDRAGATPSPSPDGADKEPAADGTTCGHSVHDVRTLSAQGAGAMSADVGLRTGIGTGNTHTAREDQTDQPYQTSVVCDEAPPVQVGQFEGRMEPRPIPINPAAIAAVQLRKAGVRDATSHHPELIAFIERGGTAEELLELVETHPGKPVVYLIRVADGIRGHVPAGAGGKRRESLTERAERLRREHDLREGIVEPDGPTDWLGNPIEPPPDASVIEGEFQRVEPEPPAKIEHRPSTGEGYHAAVAAAALAGLRPKPPIKVNTTEEFGGEL